MKRNKKSCPLCDRKISVSNFGRHVKSCKPQTKKIRGIDYNPNIGFKDGTRTQWNKGLTKEIDERVKKNGKSIAKSWKPRGCCCPEFFGCEAHLKGSSKGGGYREKSGRSAKYGKHVKDSFGKKVWLQSSYEIKCALLLDELKIKWIRPSSLKYEINGKIKRYFPDFFLVEKNIFLDPKNDYLIKQDKEKIHLVQKQNGVRVDILSQDKLNIEFLRSYNGNTND